MEQSKIDAAIKEVLIGETAARHFLYECIVTMGLLTSFHPDTYFEAYEDKQGNRIFDEEQAKSLNDYLDKIFDLFKALNLDIYKVTLEIVNSKW